MVPRLATSARATQPIFAQSQSPGKADDLGYVPLRGAILNTPRKAGGKDSAP